MGVTPFASGARQLLRAVSGRDQARGERPVIKGGGGAPSDLGAAVLPAANLLTAGIGREGGKWEVRVGGGGTSVVRGV